LKLITFPNGKRMIGEQPARRRDFISTASFTQRLAFHFHLSPHTRPALYDESRRNKVLARPNKELLPKLATMNAWHSYTIRAEGARIRLWIDDQLIVDYTEKDDAIPRTGIIAPQVHGGAKVLVRYKDIYITELAGK
jgi:hypothetical protein